MHPLTRLLISNRGRGFFRAEKPAANAEEATVWLYDYITSDDYWGGVSALSFAKELVGITAPTIHLRINSPGGDVFAGRAMEQIIREHKSKIVTHVDGYAASAASYVAIAGDEVEISPGGMFMIHKAWTLAMGNADDLAATAALLNQIDETLVATYARETGQSVEDIVAWLSAETWMTAEQSVERGFADRIASSADKSANQNRAQWDLSAYKNAPAKPTSPNAADTVTVTTTTSTTVVITDDDAEDDAADASNQPTQLDASQIAAMRRRIEVAALI
jgi:ATP-dependent Clp protease, protease subunit